MIGIGVVTLIIVMTTSVNVSIRVIGFDMTIVIGIHITGRVPQLPLLQPQM